LNERRSALLLLAVSLRVSLASGKFLLKIASRIFKNCASEVRDASGHRCSRSSKYGDAIKTAAQMGHRDTNVVHNHYKALILKSDADRFWDLKPTNQ